MRACGAALLILLLGSGCDFSFSLLLTSDEAPLSLSATIGSDPATDGHVRQDGVSDAASAILCGFDPQAQSPPPEHRGFLSFPLAGIPPGAFIESATMTVHVDRVDLPGGSPAASLALEHVHYGGELAFSAFSSPGAPLEGFPSGSRPVPVPEARRLSVAVAPELQADVSDPFLGFFQVRVSCGGGLVWIVDGAGNRAVGATRDRTLAPVLSVRYRE